jgi:hypothetical protein
VRAGRRRKEGRKKSSMLPQTGCPRHTGCFEEQWGPQSGEQAEPLPLCNAVALGAGYV